MRTIVFTAALSLAALAGCSKSESADHGGASSEEEKVPSMTMDEVDKALATKAVQAVDCNGDRTRKKVGVVPGAILISDDESFAASELPADKTTRLVFYCANSG